MNTVVVDTNVPIVANGKTEQAPLGCVERCIERLALLRKKERLLLDNDMWILREYLDHLSPSGQPGPGDLFMKWVWTHQANTKHCMQIPITPETEPGSFQEFPEDPELKGFDPSDRKFVAVALASGFDPTILNASDTDWWEYRKPLERNNVRIDFLCPELMIKGI
jgi:hypothetical protein